MIMILDSSLILMLVVALAAPAQDSELEVDLRDHYDVLAYDLELAVVPRTKTLEGLATIEARATAPLEVIQLDLNKLHEVIEVRQGQEVLDVSRAGDSLRATLARPAREGELISVSVRYRGNPEGGRFDGFHWVQSRDGSPWINTACQGLGAHYWYPCKASFFHPEDKPERVSMAISCPADLYGVSNGRLTEVVEGTPDWFDSEGKEYKTYRWRHDYPLETYAVTLNVGPYVVVEQEILVPGLEQAVPFNYYVLPENAEKAAVQFKQVPELVRIFSEAFGPFPFPDSKFALVETNFWGMEHSTAVAYGSSYPAWCKENGKSDRFANRNKWFDYILVHEVAHEWWGNAVSAEHWGHFWLHEGFGTYAEGVYVEGIEGREEADRFFHEMGRRISSRKGRLYRGDSPTSGEAYSGLIYSKGACVLNTLRHYVSNDEAWWKSLRDFNMESRYGNAGTADFRAVLERNTGEQWTQFFDQWFRGEGTPSLDGKVFIDEAGCITVEAQVTNGEFRVPLDLAWKDGESVEHKLRLWVTTEPTRTQLGCDARNSELRIENLDRLLGKHDIEVEE